MVIGILVHLRVFISLSIFLLRLADSTAAMIFTHLVTYIQIKFGCKEMQRYIFW